MLSGLLLLASVSLGQGRYLGYVTTAGAAQKVALTLDLFVVQPNDPTQFPQLHAAVKLGLGGLQSAEYVTTNYDDLQYDFTDGVLTINDPAADLSLTANVSGATQSLVDGSVLIRSAGIVGSVHLAQQSDTVGSDSGILPGDQYLPTLAGAYHGTCGSDDAVLQIETARDITVTGSQADAKFGLIGYAVRGRLGMHLDDGACPAPLFCAMRNYTSGSYDLFRGKLLLDGGNALDDCQIAGPTLTCHAHLGAATPTCTLTREATPVAAPTFYRRAEHVAATPEQKAALPAPNPPANADLIAGLQGTWTGFVHHEVSNRYQPMALTVMAYSSTNNPHNQNLVYVTGAVSLHFGTGLSEAMLSQSIDPSSFYLAPGFTLQGSNADGFLQVEDWRAGWLRGVWYSHAFGRVGTVELLKGETLPPISAHAKMVPDVTGAYVGPGDQGGDMTNAWWFNLLVPTQVPAATTSTLAMQGQYALRDGALPRQEITQGAYDFNAGTAAWMGNDGRMVTGTVGDGPNLTLFWPGAPIWDVLLPDDHGAYTYAPLPGGAP